MDLVQRELTKLATAAVIIDEMSKAAQAQDGMAKQAKMKPGLIALLAALGLAGAGAGAYAGGAFGGGGPDAAELERRRIKDIRDTPKGRGVWNAAARNARGYTDAVRNAIFNDAPAPEPKPKETIRAARYAAGGAARDAREFSNALADNIYRLLGR